MGGMEEEGGMKEQSKKRRVDSFSLVMSEAAKQKDCWNDKDREKQVWGGRKEGSNEERS